MIFPEALESDREFERFRSEVSVPLLANMTEFGKSPLLSTQQLENLGYNVAIFPVTLLRLAMQSVERGLQVLAQAGTQAEIVHEMQTRARLYEVIGYAKYAQWDQKIVNFRLEDQRDQI